MPEGELAIVLHTHMPYMEGGGEWPVALDAYLRAPAGFGTWPFGEELLFEAVASCYVPLLDVLDRHPGAGDAVADAGAVRPARASRGDRPLPGVSDRAAAADPSARRRRAARRRGAGARRRAGAFGRRVRARRRRVCDSCRPSRAGCWARSGATSSWTSSATHAILPLLATDTGIALQLQTGIESHRRRFGGWDGGLWLPECAYAPWLDPALERAGVRAACVELTNALGLGSERHLNPIRSADGPVLWPIDRAVIALAWGQGGYPSRPPYRDYHAYTTHRHRVRRIDGGPYDHDRGDAAGTGRRGRVRRDGAPTGPARGRVRVRGRHRAARALVVRGRAVAGGGARRGRPAGVGADDARRRARAPPARRGARRSRQHELGGGRRPAYLERPEGGERSRGVPGRPSWRWRRPPASG